VETEKKYGKVFFEVWARDGLKGRWTYSQRHSRFGESDVPSLFERRPYKDQEPRTPEYLYRLESDGIHIALFYDGLPKPTD
jgi:hypothetical protein